MQDANTGTPDGPIIRLDTVDAVSGEAIGEAFQSAGIDVRLRPVRAFSQLSYLGHQQRSQFDVEVHADDADAGRLILDRLQAESEEALLSEAGALVGRGDEGDSERPLGVRASRTLSPRTGALLSLIPVAGPLYAGAPLLVAVSLALNLASLWALSSARVFGEHPIATIAALVLVRLLDLLGTGAAITDHNAARKDADGSHA